MHTLSPYTTWRIGHSCLGLTWNPNLALRHTCPLKPPVFRLKTLGGMA